MDYSSNMNIVVAVISIIINSMRRCGVVVSQSVVFVWRKRQSCVCVFCVCVVVCVSVCLCWVGGKSFVVKKALDNSHEKLW